jgi:hypothetical protein
VVGVFLSFQRREGFMQKSVGSPLGSPGMGPYDGVFLPGVSAGWAANEDVPRGTAPLDETPINSLLNNPSSPGCCGKSFLSSSTGCVCLSPTDDALFASRGGNRAV